jgi:hypothetical protein
LLQAIDGNGFDDLVIGGNALARAQLFYNSRVESFTGACLPVRFNR